MHGDGRGQVEEQDAGLLILEPRPVDPPQAPQGGTDQTAGVGRGDRQLDVLSGVRRAWRGSHGTPSAIQPFCLQAGEQLSGLLLGRGVSLLLVEAVREHRQQPARRPLHGGALPQDQHLAVRQILHEVPERQHHAQRRPVGPSGDHALPDAFDPAQEGVLFLPDEVTERLEEGGLQVGAQGGDVGLGSRCLIWVGWDEHARCGGERIEEVGRDRELDALAIG